MQRTKPVVPGECPKGGAPHGTHHYCATCGWREPETFAERLTEYMAVLARIGSSLCAYCLPTTEAWIKGPCDCKFGSRDIAELALFGAKLTHPMATEVTGCAEVRQAWRVLAMLRERATDVE